MGTAAGPGTLQGVAGTTPKVRATGTRGDAPLDRCAIARYSAPSAGPTHGERGRRVACLAYLGVKFIIWVARRTTIAKSAQK